MGGDGGIVARVLPWVESYLRLVTRYLLEYTEDWANDYAYIKADKLSPEQEQNFSSKLGAKNGKLMIAILRTKSDTGNPRKIAIIQMIFTYSKIQFFLRGMDRM